MLSNLNKIVKGQEIHREEEKESNRLYYYLEIAQTLKDNQIKRSQNRKRKRGEEEKGGEELEQEEDREEQERQGKKGKKEMCQWYQYGVQKGESTCIFKQTKPK